MHILVGLAVLVGLIAFAFGEGAARGFVRACLLFAGIALLAGVTYFAVDVLRDEVVSAIAVEQAK